MLVREDVARAQLGKAGTGTGDADQPGPADPEGEKTEAGPSSPQPSGGAKRFYGSVELDTVRPIKAFEAIMDAVVMQLQHAPGTKIKLTLDIEATSEPGFSEADIGVVRDNARQLKFKPESTGFDE